MGSTIHASDPPWKIHKMLKTYNLSLNFRLSIAWMVRPLNGALLSTFTGLLLWDIMASNLLHNPFTGSRKQSAISHQPPPPSTWKRVKNENKKKIFLKNIEIRRFFIASVGALCLEYRFYAIFCFKAATLALETKKMAKSDIFERARRTRQYKAHSPWFWLSFLNGLS